MNAILQPANDGDERMSMFQNIPVSDIRPDPDQPRQYFDEAGLAELAQSIESNGLAVPVLVRPLDDGFMLVHGERRWRAVQSLGWADIPAEVRQLTADEARRLSLIENIQRQDLSPIEEGRAFRKLLDGGFTQVALGKQIGKDQSYIAQKLRLLTLPPPLLLLTDRRLLTENHARQLLKIRKWFGDLADVEHLHLTVPDEQRDRAFWLVPMRPFEYPIITLPERYDALLHPFLCSYAEWVNLHNGRAPLWSRWAFFFAAWSVIASATVADLSKALDSAFDRLQGALAWWHFRAGWKEKTHDKWGQIEYWAYHDDLRQGGLIESLELRSDLPKKMILDAATYAVRHGGMATPTQLQPHLNHVDPNLVIEYRAHVSNRALMNSGAAPDNDADLETPP
jgi:ParB/RepB/Spo0J family partition protein